MKSALIEHYAIDPGRVRVHYPGYRADAFAASRTAMLRMEARRKLGLDGATPLVGFVTSGDFQTRGIDIFLAAAERIRAAEPETKFLVVGSKRLPASAQRHPLVAAGHVLYRPKSGRPELWMSALDVFLYPSRFDAFGIVIAEAQALGIPVLTSRRAGAAECLPEDYAPWLSDTPDDDVLAAHTLQLLADTDLRRSLAAAGIASVTRFSRERYVTECVATILAQNA
jgi:UDP-glucose:(heptosyl)LPS alpha-1,3-glucosyltransferase